MAEFGELCLWAALPLAALAAAGSIGGALSGRGELAAMGGRAVEAVALLTLVSVAGLASALITVRLSYVYVASYSGFQLEWPWRLAALWTGPAGAALTLTFLIALTGALSYRLGRSRQTAARTGALAVLAVMGLLTAIARARPFFQSDVPAAMGAGLPLSVRELAWQVEVASVLLAIACASFVFAGIVGAQLTESLDGQRAERVAMTVAVGLVTVAITASTWRVYSSSGRLLDITGLSSVVVHAPAWLLAFAYLHAPGGRAVPAWASRWRRILGVAFFPAVLGGGAALLAGLGNVPPAVLWAGGFAVGVLSGAMTGMTRQRLGSEELRGLPGFGPWAFQGGLLTFAFAGLLAVWGLAKGAFWGQIVWPIVLLGLTASAVWAVARPAGRWRRVWLAAGVSGLAVGGGAYALSGRTSPEFVIAAALAAATIVGLAADGVRLRAVRRAARADWSDDSVAAVLKVRSARRRAAAFSHLAVALIVVGLAAGFLTRVESQPLSPGGTLALPGEGAAAVKVTYLGLSRYQSGDIDRRVASFSLYQAQRAPELVTAVMSFDMAERRQYRRPALIRGPLSDVILEVAGFSASTEGIVCRLARRPLASLVWLGGLLLLVAVTLRGRLG